MQQVSMLGKSNNKKRALVRSQNNFRGFGQKITSRVFKPYIMYKAMCFNYIY